MRKLKKVFPFALVACMVIGAMPLSACNETDENVLRIASWDEYIDEGGEDSYKPDSLPLYEEFETWYLDTYGKEIKVEYVTLQDNETMYNQIKMGNSYDLLCPSEYMCMKLANEKLLQKYPDSFFDKTNPNNYYAQNVSPYIHDVDNNGGVFNNEQMRLENGDALSSYVAGYMWGTTGFVFNPEKVERADVQRWDVLLSDKYSRKITAKDNVRDSYFMGLGLLYEKDLLDLKTSYEQGLITSQTYRDTLFSKMNDTSHIPEVQKLLERMRRNLYGLETDEGKLDVVTGRFDISYQWSGDAVYTMDVGEENEMNDESMYLEYAIPDSASNLFFDAWVLMKDCKNVDAATAFVNFISMPENVVRNMYYIGYTSCISGAQSGENTIFDYVTETYGYDEVEDAEETAVAYNLDYFFGAGHELLVPESQTRRQLYAQYPKTETIERLVVMKAFTKSVNETLNRMWNSIK